MSDWHGYFGIENLALNAAQKQQLVQALRALGPAEHPSPAKLNHWRVRLDGDAAIFEALFNENALAIGAFKNRLAAIFGIDPADIGHSVQQRSFGGYTTPVVTFSYGGTDYLRVALFGGTGATWQESGDECRGYLALHRDEWESEEI